MKILAFSVPQNEPLWITQTVFCPTPVSYLICFSLSRPLLASSYVTKTGSRKLNMFQPTEFLGRSPSSFSARGFQRQGHPQNTYQRIPKMQPPVTITLCGWYSPLPVETLTSLLLVPSRLNGATCRHMGPCYMTNCWPI